MNPTPSPTPDDVLSPIAPPLPYVSGVDTVWLLAGLGVILLVALGLVWWFFLRKRRPAPTAPALSPRQQAAARLREIQARMHETDARTFGNEVCDVLRAFIAAEYRLQPQRQTSPEFLADAARSRRFSAGEHALLGEFLDRCDLLKFARADATPAAKERLLAQAVEFIEGAGVPPPLPPPPLPNRPPPLPVSSR